MPQKVLIPVAKLQIGFDNCVKHIRNLIASSELLYSSQLYPSAFSLAVLAIEEDAKLGVIQEHIRDKKAILHSEWQDLTRGGSHKVKLVMQLQKERTMMKGFSPEKSEAIKRFNERLGVNSRAFDAAQWDRPQDYTRFQLLDTMKQDCFYLGWRYHDWWSFYTAFTTEEQEAMVWLLLRQARSWLLLKIISNHYPNPVQNTESELIKLHSDPIVAEFIELNKVFGTTTFLEKARLATQTMAKYRQNT